MCVLSLSLSLLSLSLSLSLSLYIYIYIFPKQLPAVGVLADLIESRCCSPTAGAEVPPQIACVLSVFTRLTFKNT